MWCCNFDSRAESDIWFKWFFDGKQRCRCTTVNFPVIEVPDEILEAIQCDLEGRRVEICDVDQTENLADETVNQLDNGDEKVPKKKKKVCYMHW